MAALQTSGLKVLSNTTAGSATFAMPGSFTAGRSAVLTVTHFNSSGLQATGATLGGTAATKVKDFQNTNNGNYWTSIWFVQSMAGGTANFSVVFADTSASYIACSCEEWPAFAASAADANASGERIDTSVTPTLILTTGAKAQNSEVVYAVGVTSKTISSSIGLTGPTGMGAAVTQTALQNTGGTDIGIAAGYCEVNASGTESATWTIGTGGAANEIDGVMATFKKAAVVVNTPKSGRLGIGIGI